MDPFSVFGSVKVDHCAALQDISYLNLALSVLLLVGILVSYLPQHYKIITRGTPEGISAGFILLGEISSTCTLANILLLPGSRADVACCKTISPFECIAGLLGIAQVGIQWSCFTVLFLLFIIFTPRSSDLPSNSNHDHEAWWKAMMVAILGLVWAVGVIVISTALSFSRPDLLTPWAYMLGITAAILAILQYFPQLLETWQLGHAGSLSIPMMLIQTPGSFVWAGSLAARLGKDGWSSWGSFLLTGCLQGCLLAMCITFEVRNKHNKQITEGECPSGSGARCIVGYMGGQNSTETDDEGGAVVGNVPSERTPLINNKTQTPSQDH